MQHDRPLAPGANAESDELRLLACVAGGDRRAFEALYRLYFHRLSRFVGRMSRSAALIEEVINDTMLVVWQKAASFDGSCKVSTWIFAIAYRTTLKGLRLGDDPVESDSALYEDESGTGPDQEMDRQQLQQSITQALAQLPVAQRIVMVLAYYHDMAYGEIADVVGCPLNTVKTRMFHARHSLRDLLSNQIESRR